MNNFKFNRVLIFDIEATCWEKGDLNKQIREPISFGACILNINTLEITKQQEWFIKPIKSNISDYCYNLTKIDNKKVKQGIQFKDLCNILINKWGSKNILLISWGNDYHFMKEFCSRNYYQAKFPFGNEWLNLSPLFMICNNLNKRSNLNNALNLINKSFIGQQHSSLDDAINTAYIFKELIQQYRKS